MCRRVDYGLSYLEGIIWRKNPLFEGGTLRLLFSKCDANPKSSKRRSLNLGFLSSFIIVFGGNVNCEVWQGNNYTGKLHDISYLISL